jgi:Ubiquitin-conjugating enzyme
MTTNRMRRIAKELGDIQKDTQSQIMAQPAGGDDLSHLKASFPGPPDTPYEGGTYVVDIKIPQEYPFRPPVMKFETKLWHPNVSSVTVRESFDASVLDVPIVNQLIIQISLGSYLPRYSGYSLVSSLDNQICSVVITIPP